MILSKLLVYVPLLLAAVLLYCMVRSMHRSALLSHAATSVPSALANVPPQERALIQQTKRCGRCGIYIAAGGRRHKCSKACPN